MSSSTIARPEKSPAPSSAVKIFWSASDWARAIAELPTRGPLPCRTVLVPRERVAHVLRRELIRSGRGEVLAGTRFLKAPFAAAEVMRAAGTTFEPGEESFRSARLLALFRSGLPLAHFPLELLRSTPGWDDAFARTISDLEAAGLRPSDLELPGSADRLKDVAAVWRALDDSAGSSWTIPRVYSEAGAALEGNPTLWYFPGPVLACAGSDVTAAEARFLRAIPGATLGLLAARPLRKRFHDRIEGLLGKKAREALLSANLPQVSESERDLLASFLFESPAALADPARPRSAGPDGTVDLEEHSGVEEELEATADWVARQVGAGIPLEEIAILLPSLDPIADLVVQRLARLPFGEGALPVHAAGGLLLAGLPAGARALALVRALRAHLSAPTLADLLPSLRTIAEDGRHLSRTAAMTLAWSLGTVGGNAARPEGALEWADRADSREKELAERLALARAEEEKDPATFSHSTKRIERLLEDLRAISPALQALGRLSAEVISGATLRTLWGSLASFLGEWLLQPGEGSRVEVLLDDRLAALASDPACGSLAGDDALRVMEEAITSVRVPLGRFGDPAVYVGSVRQAVGLSFRAVRVIGLAEGRLPSMPREDPVLPDSLREQLTFPGAPATVALATTAADRALEDLHSFDLVTRSAQERVALSAPRTDLDRTQREPSSVFLEAAAALGRPNRATGKPGPTIPDGPALERDSFRPARESAAAFRRERPLAEAAWQDGVSRSELVAPPHWSGNASLDLPRIEALRTLADAGAMDGMLGISDLDIAIPGMTADRPISASDLAVLLGCPHQFLLSKLLGFGDPGADRPQREIDPLSYGSLFHTVAAAFSAQHGSSFCARGGTIGDWMPRADAISDSQFDEFVKEYPLVGEAVRAKERQRLRRDLRELLEYEWANPKGRRFVAAEKSFGRPTPIELNVGGRSLFVRGQIDRIDVEGGTTIVTDFKTGRPYPRSGKEKTPQPGLDLQIALYGIVARSQATEWKVPKKVAAGYVYVGRSAASERSFRDDFDGTLEPVAREWLGVAAGLLSERIFPRTPEQEDCKYCRFQPVCGDAVYERAAELLEGGVGSVGEFGLFKRGAPEEEDE